MSMRAGLRQHFGLGICLVFAASLAGCDYWPPALQVQIEQLRSEIETLTMEKTQLQSQVNELSKAKQQLQMQIDELGRVNREKSSLIASLQRQVEALRTKPAAARVASKGATKPAAKPAPKMPAKKTSAAKP